MKDTSLFYMSSPVGSLRNVGQYASIPKEEEDSEIWNFLSLS